MLPVLGFNGAMCFIGEVMFFAVCSWKLAIAFEFCNRKPV